MGFGKWPNDTEQCPKRDYPEKKLVMLIYGTCHPVIFQSAEELCNHAAATEIFCSNIYVCIELVYYLVFSINNKLNSAPLLSYGTKLITFSVS